MKLFWVVWAAVTIFYIATMWMVFEKAGKPGWASIIPIYNAIVMLDIAGRPAWWFILMLIPLVNIVVLFIVMINLAEAFGKSAAFGIGLALLGFVFFPILAFGDAEYRGRAHAT